MSTNTSGSPVSQEKNQAPVWARPIIRAGQIISPYALVFASILLLGLFTMLTLGRVDSPLLLQAISALSFLAIFGYICLLIAQYLSVVPGWFGVVLGTALYKGSPFLVRFILQQNGLANDLNRPGTTAIQNFVTQFSTALVNIGLTLAILSVTMLLFVYIMRAVASRGQARYHTIKYLDMTDKDALRRDVIPKCWQMSRCRPVVRPLCPNYIDRIPCWKRRGGCFCHRELGNYLKDAVERRTTTEEPTTEDMREAKRLFNAIRDRLKATKPSWRDQKPRCFSCPLYDEHQEYKYRNLTWINFPIAILVLLAIYYPYDWAYTNGMTYVDAWVQSMLQKNDFLSQAMHAAPLAHSPFEWVLFAMIALLLFSYIMALTEVAFLKWKL